MRIWGWIALSMIAPPAWSHFVSLDLSAGSDDYRQASFQGRAEVDKAGINLGYTKIESSNFDGSLGITKELRLGADYQARDWWRFWVDVLTRDEPNQISAKGASLGTDFRVATWGSDRLETHLFAEVSRVAYTQKTVISGPLIDTSADLSTAQRSFSLGLDQEVSLEWSFYTVWTKYQYEENKAELLINNQRRQFALENSQGLVAGLPESSLLFGIDYQHWAQWIFGINVSQTKIEPDALKSSSLGFVVEFLPTDHWLVRLSPSWTQYEIGPDEDENFYLVSLGGVYLF